MGSPISPSLSDTVKGESVVPEQEKATIIATEETKETVEGTESPAIVVRECKGESAEADDDSSKSLKKVKQ